MNKELELNKLIKLYKESDFKLKQINEIIKDHGIGVLIGESSEIKQHSERWWNRKHELRTNIINLLLTHKGERFMQPKFGTDLRRFVFRPNTSNLTDDIREDLLESIKFWLPYVKVESIDIDRSSQNIEDYVVHISITFSVTNDITKFTTVTFNFNSAGGVSVGDV